MRDRALALTARAASEGLLGVRTRPEALVDAAVGGLIYRAAILGKEVSAEQACGYVRELLGLAPQAG